ncbi:hypothetical protein KUDE01_026270 [Dissostichus eleginoides]|uniref:Uncharacterized protein n=1 Tax=Dissostichus eleginoides TaxID=100907 RepID=A0AAD9EXJ2_DISEL|nr:hypothetical protein KUDE01_026270 [Dissostichus eleginoides]
MTQQHECRAQSVVVGSDEVNVKTKKGNVARGAQHNWLSGHYRLIVYVLYTRRCTRTHQGRERVCGLALDARAVAVSTLARAAVGDAAPVLSRVTEPLQPSACPLHLVSPRQRETALLPNQCKPLVLLSRATVSNGSMEKPLLSLTSISAPTKMGKQNTKGGKKIK